MKGYYTDTGYKGYVDGEGYMIFEDEAAYYEYQEAIKDANQNSLD